MLKDFSNLSLDYHFFKSNHFEQSILRDYCNLNGITLPQIMQDILQKIDSGDISMYCNGFSAKASDPLDPNFKPVLKELSRVREGDF
ncbi:hypothetical protein HDU67_006514 [Dinochytrium kinnereticum]|nr:hypothetical protein HDU67_006514 [Dinochytrium kinnereticum]